MQKTILFSIAISLCMFSIAQQTDFSGKWVINKSKISFGQAPENVLSKGFNVEQKKREITIERILLDDQLNEHPFSETLPFDGSETTNTTFANGKKTTSTKWADDKATFILSSKSISADGKPGNSYTEKWSLEDSGNSLVIDRNVEQADGMKYSIKAYYDKQK